MADATAAGTSTSEFKLAAVAMVLGTILEGAGAVLHALQDAGVQAPWIPAVLAALGVILQVASLFGYTKSRTILKAADIASGVAAKPPSP
jgi:hypothetical protein